MKTGNTAASQQAVRQYGRPQWSPVMKTGNTGALYARYATGRAASMEPGHEDREYTTRAPASCCASSGLNGARS